MWIAVSVPVVALVELLAFSWQLRPTMSDADWKKAKQIVASKAKPADLIVFAPDWVDPLGRWHFGDKLMTEQRTSFADTSRFPRVIEVGWHGHHHWATGGFVEKESLSVGPFVIRTLVNPHPRPVIDDLLEHVSPEGITVQRVTGNMVQACSWGHFRPITGALGAGPAAPADRFSCAGGGWVGITVIADLDYRARRCLYAPPPGGQTALRVTFHHVKLGKELVIHHGLFVEAERDEKGAPVHVSWSVDGKGVGRTVHRDGEGWREVVLGTQGASGGEHEVTAEVRSANGNRRMYCFEATTR